MQDRYRPGAGRQGGRYPQGGGNRRRRGGRRPHETFPEFGGGPEGEELAWSPEEGVPREPNPDADDLHLAYDSVYTHEGDIREELLEGWVSASESGKRWRCWNCNRQNQRFTQLRFPTFRTVLSICENCGIWTVWDAWRDIANPRMFSFRRAMESETAPAPTAEPAKLAQNGGHANGSRDQTVPLSPPPELKSEPPATLPAVQPSATTAPVTDIATSPAAPADSAKEATASSGGTEAEPAVKKPAAKPRSSRSGRSSKAGSDRAEISTTMSTAADPAAGAPDTSGQTSAPTNASDAAISPAPDVEPRSPGDQPEP